MIHISSVKNYVNGIQNCNNFFKKRQQRKRDGEKRERERRREREGGIVVICVCIRVCVCVCVNEKERKNEREKAISYYQEQLNQFILIWVNVTCRFHFAIFRLAFRSVLAKYVKINSGM